MPEKSTLKRARKAKRQGKSASTQAGEFIREEIHHIRRGSHGARSTEQAIAIGLSKARRAGVKLRAPRSGAVSAETREQIRRDERIAHEGSAHQISPGRSRGAHRKLEHEGKAAASHAALSAHARKVARRRGPAQRRASSLKAARTRARTH
ncbi:MAG TPA: DNA-binding protein [Candidatus Eisenbacteria bacterium]|nr:DNA-binding protein [Candidatus Eisenbacteria bacterium]